MNTNYDNYLNRILGYKAEIKNFFKKNEKTIENRKELSDILFQSEFKTEYENFNEYTKQYNEFMLDKQNELNEIENLKRKEKNKFGSIEKKIKRNIDFLKSEENTLSDIHLNLEEYQSHLSSFSERFKKANTRISSLLSGVAEYEGIAKKEIDEELIYMKESLEKFFEEEKEKITQYLDISSQSIIEDKFNIENLKISQGKRDNFYFDLNLFIKYILLLGLIFGIAIIDFLLVQHIVVEEFNLERNADKTLVFLVHYIIPFLPSFVLIFGEFLVLKYLKQKKFLKKVVHTFATIIVLIVVFSVFVTINGTQVQFIEPIIFDLVSRILIFVIAIPVTVSILVNFFKTHEFFDFIRHLLLPVLLPMLGLRYFLEKFILKRKRDNLIRESYVFEIDTSAIKNFQENLFDNTAFTGIPRTFHDDLNQVSLKTEKAISDIKQLQAFISQKESNKVGFFGKIFSIFSSRKTEQVGVVPSIELHMHRLKLGLRDVVEEMKMYEDAVDIKFEKEILNINDSINNVEKEREIYKEEYEQKKSNLIQAIHDGIQQTI